MSDVFDARTAERIRRCNSLICSCEAGHIIDELEGELVSHVLDGCGRLEGSEEAIGVRNVEFLGNSSW